MAKYKVHIFKTSNNFTVNSLTGNVTADKMEYLVVAGGGGGGYNYGGGGGAGGVLSANSNIIATTYTVTVGAGGSGSLTDDSVQGFNGSNSLISGNGFTTVNSVGGGGGGSDQNKSGKPGGSGGGNSINGGTGGSGIPGQGNPGGTDDAAGGGGAGDAGSGTRGGNGIYSTISGSNVAYGGGGGGWGRSSLEPGGIGGGGAGNLNDSPTPAVNGTVNTGGGGGGGAEVADPPSAGADGGSGIVIIRYPLIPRPIASRISSVTSVSTDANTYYGDGIFTMQVTTANVVTNETLYYSVNNTSNSDVVGGNTGSFTITSNNYVEVPVTLSITGTSNITMQVRRNSGTGTVLGESEIITIQERLISGGNIIDNETETIHVFTSSGILTTAPSLSSPVIANVMLIGGGGRGGPYGQTYGGGGGGAGGIRFANVELRAGNTFTITVGAGAPAAQHNPTNQVFDGGFASLNYLAAEGIIIGNFSKFDAPSGYVKGLSDGIANVNYRAWGGGQGAGVRNPPSLGGGWFTSSRGGSGGGGGGTSSTPPTTAVGGASTGNYTVLAGNPGTFVGRSDADLYEDLGSPPAGNTALNISWTYNSGYDGGAGGLPSSGGGGGGGGGHGSASDPAALVGAAGGIGIGISGLPTSYGTPGPVPGLRYFAGGGGGGMGSQSVQPNPALRGGGIGGDGGGGRGGGGNNPVYTPPSEGYGSAGLQNTGGGGGGGGKPNQTVVNPTCIGGAGGSGIVIIRYSK